MKLMHVLYIAVGCFAFSACDDSNKKEADKPENKEEPKDNSETGDTEAKPPVIVKPEPPIVILPKPTPPKPTPPKPATPDTVGDEMATLFEKIAPIIKSGKDDVSVTAALAKLDVLLEDFKALMERNKDLVMTPAKERALSQRMYKVGERMGKESMTHILGLQETQPDAAQKLQTGFMKLLTDIDEISKKY